MVLDKPLNQIAILDLHALDKPVIILIRTKPGI